MTKISIANPPRSSCSLAKQQCLNCHSQFREIRPLVTGAVITHRFIKDFRDAEEAKANVNAILECSNLDYHEMHKFEENIDGNLVFRAKKDGVHLVYVLDKSMRIIFLRAFRSFSEYGKFLSNKKEIRKILARV
ncbi:MAG: hypothetical protein NWF05_03840 [Candidatus Bathyarchaeota archaeon]|nr:hypothetical protein [Candidatus Bathyarchaeota archaeon]